MKTLHRRCAGLDVHSDSVVACARVTVRTKVTHEVRRFSTTTQAVVKRAAVHRRPLARRKSTPGIPKPRTAAAPSRAPGPSRHPPAAVSAVRSL
jgi:hypothetical protein